MIFDQENLLVRPLEESDASYLAKWLSDERVLEFYEGRDNPHDIKKIREVFYSKAEQINTCIVEYKSEPVGYLQFYPSTYDDKALYGYSNEEKLYGMDQFIGEPEYWNKGIGTKLVKGVSEYLLDSKIANIVSVDPQTRNERAIRCYEKCGFKKVKLLPNQELHEGMMQDCWLMEYRK